MARFCDFVVDYDPEKDTRVDVTRRVLVALMIRPLQGNMPVITFVGGKSGRGKSMAVLKCVEEIMTAQGLNILDFMDDINIYKPTEYTKKWTALLHDKRLKKVNICIVHEARELIGAKQWHDFLSQTMSTTTAISREVKRISLVIISQDISDITKDMRKLVDYYVRCDRKPFKQSKMKWSVIYQDERDLEKVHLRKRRMKGYIRYPNGRMRAYMPRDIVMSLPATEVRVAFSKADYHAKSLIIQNRFEKLNKIMEKEYGLGNANEKIKAMVEYYMKDTDALVQIARNTKKGYKLLPFARSLHDLSPAEETSFVTELNKRMVEIMTPRNLDVDGGDGDGGNGLHDEV